MNTTDQFNESSLAWIEHLALEELNMNESGVISIDDHLNPAALLEDSSIRFMDTLRDKFDFYVAKFNEYRGGHNTGSQIKTFKISNTVNDFMLFRNALRLVVARRSHDLITIGFVTSGKEFYGARLSLDEGLGHQAIHEIRAHIGAFNKITWRFAGEEVDPESLVRHYLSEFIKHSVR